VHQESEVRVDEVVDVGVDGRQGRAWRSWLRRLHRLDGALVLLGVFLTLLLTHAVWRSADLDVGEYDAYARAFWLGSPRFSALPREYPPLALIPFSLTLLPPHGDPTVPFMLWMGVLTLAGYIGFRRFSTRRRAFWYAFYLLLGAQGTVLARYDLVPALATLAALWAAQRRRFAVAYLLLAAGILLKVYPLALAPLLAIEQWRTPPVGDGSRVVWDRRRRLARVARGLALCGGVVMLGFNLALWRNPSGGLSALEMARGRPVQVESVPATLAWLASLAGVRASIIFSFGSHNYTGPLADALAPLSTLALAAACLWVYWRLWRREMTLAWAFLACLCALLALSKVFSAQYLIWALPLAAEVGGDEILWLLICLLTLLDYPAYYPFSDLSIPPSEWWKFLVLLACRNTLIVTVTTRLLWRKRTSPSSVSVSISVPGESRQMPIAIADRRAQPGMAAARRRTLAPEDNG
jgi:hypothetical protein